MVWLHTVSLNRGFRDDELHELIESVECYLRGFLGENGHNEEDADKLVDSFRTKAVDIHFEKKKGAI